jgi:hypothetical protein
MVQISLLLQSLNSYCLIKVVRQHKILGNAIYRESRLVSKTAETFKKKPYPYLYRHPLFPPARIPWEAPQAPESEIIMNKIECKRWNKML